MSDTRVTLHFAMSDGTTQDADFVIPDPMSVSADPDNAIEVKADGLFVPTVKTLASEFTEDAWWYVDYQGYLHQGGTAGTTDGEDVITFPQAFAAAPFDYGIVDHSWSADGVDGVGVSPDELTATEMGIYSYSLPEDGPSTTSLRWHATGLAPAELLDTIGGIGIQGPQGPAAVITSEDGSITVVQNAQTGETDLSVPAGGGGGVTSITSEDESVTVVVDDETGAVDLSVPDSGGGSSTVIQSADGSVGVTKDPASNTYDLTVAPMDTWLADVHISVNPQLTVVGEAVSSGITLNLASIQNLHNYDYLYLNLAVIVTTSVATENTDLVMIQIGTFAGSGNVGSVLNVLLQNVAEGRIARPILSGYLMSQEVLVTNDVLTLYVNTTLQSQSAIEPPITVAVQIDGDLYGTNNTEIAHISSSVIPV